MRARFRGREIEFVRFVLGFILSLSLNKNSEADGNEKQRRDHSLDFVERNNIDRLNEVFEFTDFLFKKVSSDLKNTIEERREEMW